MRYYIQLLRPINLLIVGLTMYTLGWYFSVENEMNVIQSLPFLGIVLATIFITGAGNVINDCFDIDADEINKPKKQIVGRFISVERAKKVYFILNFLALSISLNLSLKWDNYSFLCIHLLTIPVLWLYSNHFKKKVFVGNVVVAFFTGVIPMLVVLFFEVSFPSTQFHLPVFGDKISIFSFGMFFGIFAFLLNFSREVVKDIEDMEGDKKINANTISIRYGVKKARFFAVIPLVVSLFLLGYTVYYFEFLLGNRSYVIVLITASWVLRTIIGLFEAKTKENFTQVGKNLKISMLFGAITPLLWG